MCVEKRLTLAAEARVCVMSYESASGRKYDESACARRGGAGGQLPSWLLHVLLRAPVVESR